MQEENQDRKQVDIKVLPSQVIGLVEALIFAADEPLSEKQLKDLITPPANSEEPCRIELPEIKQIINDLNESYLQNQKPFRIIEIAGGFQFATLPDYALWVGRLYAERAKRKLSQSALETLAIVAYKQPITKPEIERIRGVNCDYVVKTLLEKDLVTIVGRAESVGRPLLYGTTRQFLIHFGLNSITDLPRPREIEEILGESKFETERRMLEAQAAAERAKKQQEEEDFKSRLPHIPKRKSILKDAQLEIFDKEKASELRTVRTEKPQMVEGQKVEAPEPEIEKSIVPREGEISKESVIENVSTEAPPNEVPTIITSETESVESESTVVQVPEKPFTITIVKQPEIIEESTPEIRLLESQEPNHFESDKELNKTRWQRWRDTIKGFIKKLFG
jgi:segregation and condensation protein B